MIKFSTLSVMGILSVFLHGVEPQTAEISVMSARHPLSLSVSRTIKSMRS